MKQDIIKITYKTVIIAIIIIPYIFLCYHLKDRDINYNKHMSKGDNLIIGLSRATHGIIPGILTDSLNTISPHKFRNIAFAGSISTYTEKYCNFCKEQVKKKDKDHIFILSVTPGSFNIEKNQKNYFLFKYNNPSIISVLDIFYHFNIFGMINIENRNHIIYSKQGYTDMKIIKPFNTNKSRLFFDKSLRNKKISKDGLRNFRSLISYFKDYGDVYIVRIPISPKFRESEQKSFPDFDSLIKDICNKEGVPYLNTFKNNYKTFDLQHMERREAEIFTKELIEQIKS